MIDCCGNAGWLVFGLSRCPTRQHCAINNALFSSTVDRKLQFRNHRILTSAITPYKCSSPNNKRPRCLATPVAQTMEDNPQLQQLKQQGLDFLDAILREVESLGGDVYLLRRAGPGPRAVGAVGQRFAQPIVTGSPSAGLESGSPPWGKRPDQAARWVGIIPSHFVNL